MAPLEVVQQRLELGRALSCRLHKEPVVETVKQVEWSTKQHICCLFDKTVDEGSLRSRQGHVDPLTHCWANATKPCCERWRYLRYIQ